MSYVDSNLLPGEVVKFRTQLHKILFVVPAIVAMACFGLGIWLGQYPAQMKLEMGCYLLTFLVLIPSYIQYKTSEFAVTNKRVIVKVGFISRQTLETLLQKIEAISVDQDILGRMLNYGTITVVGTGGTRESFANIAQPLEFRRAIQEQTDAQSSK